MMVLTISLCIVLGVIDYFTGHEVSSSIFYLLPVFLVAWFAGKGPMLLVSVIGTASGNPMYPRLKFVTEEHSVNKNDADVR